MLARFIQHDLPPPVPPLGRWLMAEVLLLVLLGTAGLLLPAAHHGTLGGVDALLLATSAVCTTGLSSVNIAEVLTPAGQLWLMLLVELGALGALVLAFAVAELGRGRLDSEELSDAAGDLGLATRRDFRGLVRRVLGLCLGIQACGFVVLLPDMIHLTNPVQGARYALMHAVMAFGNAGFGLWNDGVARLSPLSLLTLMTLVVLGGLGFVTMDELERRWLWQWRYHRRPRPLTTQTQVGLKMTAWLLVGGAALFALLEWSQPGTLGPLDTPHKLLHAAFQTTVTRSAGFSTLDYGLFHSSTLMLIMALMLVGGNPGSTAGGIKTTTLAVLLAATRATLRREQDAALAGRRIPAEVLMRSLTIVTLAVAATGLGTVALTLTDGRGHRPIVLAFEAISAFTTSGLSVNLTPHLSAPGKLVLVVLMFLGRVGFLSLLLAFNSAQPAPERPLVEEEFTVG